MAITGVLVFISWLVFGGSPAAEPAGGSFGLADTTTEVQTPAQTSTGAPNTPMNTANTSQKIFKISDGPVAGATFVETQNPTTTIARFVMAENGRAFDLTIDSPGAVPRAISNTTIPGIARVEWAGPTAVLQYQDGEVLKTLSLGLPAATTSLAAAPVRIQFLPNNVIDVAASPTGTSLAYLIKTPSGSDGYVANADGSSPRKLFSLPLSQMLLSWPAAGTLLAQTPPMSGVLGMAFTINATTGATESLLEAVGLSLTGDPTLSQFVYSIGGTTGGSYRYIARTGLSQPLSFSPLPEQCVWSRMATSTVYCTAPAAYTEPGYTDARRMGLTATPHQIMRYSDTTTVIAVPGADGGTPSDIATMALSLNEKYLLFIKKGERSLWGIRLGSQ